MCFIFCSLEKAGKPALRDIHVGETRGAGFYRVRAMICFARLRFSDNGSEQMKLRNNGAVLVSLTISPILMGLPAWVKVSLPGGMSDASRMELLQSNQTRSRESILKLRDMRHIRVFLNSTSLTCATTLSQHLCTCDGNTLPRSGAADRITTAREKSF